MKKRTLNIGKLNLKKEVISNLNEIKGGVNSKSIGAPTATGYTGCATCVKTSDNTQCCW
jgi:hypothetical protein